MREHESVSLPESVQADQSGSGALAEVELQQKIEDRVACVGVIGLGYVGLPLARAFGRCGFPVLGFDIDSEKVGSLADAEANKGVPLREEISGVDV